VTSDEDPASRKQSLDSHLSDTVADDQSVLSAAFVDQSAEAGTGDNQGTRGTDEAPESSLQRQSWLPVPVNVN